MTEWRIHLGVHKTATTHLQEVLRELSPTLAGIGYVPVETLRPATSEIFRPPGLRRRLFGGRADSLEDILRPLAGNHECVILSEENWIGEAWEACVAPPYPQLECRLEKLRGLPKTDTMRFFLSIRDPGDFATSIVGEALRHHPERVSLEKARVSWLAAKSPWSDLVTRVQKAFPEVPLIVWPYEDYRANAQALAETLIGSPIADCPQVADPVATKRPSADTVAQLIGNRWKRSADHANLTGDGSFTLFTEDERQTLAARYEDDKKAILGAFPGVLIKLDK